MEVGDLVRILHGKHRGQVGTIKACSGEDGYVIDLGGGKLKMFTKDGVSSVAWYWTGLSKEGSHAVEGR